MLLSNRTLLMISVVAGAVCIYLLWQQRRELLRIRAGLDYSDINMSRKELQTEQLIELTTENKRLQMTANVLNDRIDNFQTMVENSYDNVHRQYTEILKAIDSLPAEYSSAESSVSHPSKTNDSYKNEEFMFEEKESSHTENADRAYSLDSPIAQDMKGISQISEISEKAVSEKAVSDKSESAKAESDKSLQSRSELAPEPSYSSAEVSHYSKKSYEKELSEQKSHEQKPSSLYSIDLDVSQTSATPKHVSRSISNHTARKSLTVSLSDTKDGVVFETPASQTPEKSNNPHDFSDMKIAELRQKCRQLNISSQGNKQELVERLVAHYAV